MRLRKLAIATGITGAMLGAAWLSAPWATRKYIESKYPGVIVGSVKLSLDSAELRDVHITKPYGVAHLEKVTVHKDGSVEAEGGNATVRIDLLPEGSSTPGDGRKVTAKGLQVRVMLDTSHATFEGVSYEAGKVCWNSASAVFGKLRGYDPCPWLACGSNGMVLGEAGPGCATRDKIEVAKVETEISLKRDVPHFPSFGTVTLEGVTAYPNGKTIDVQKVSYGPVQALEATVEREGPTTRLILGQLILTHPWLGKGPLTFTHGIMVEKQDGASPITITHGGVPVRIDPDTLTIRAEARCHYWAAAMPIELATPILDLQWANEGTLSFDIDLRAPKVKIRHTCKASCKSPLLVALRKPFKYLAYDSKDARFEREAGPGTRDWTYIQDVGKDMPTAVIAMEDPGFPSHHGYIGQAFENSLKDNLKTGKFLRGGSTITMQLAKNLWLYRDKTITRKLQEVLFAIALEDCYSKSEILELYLNVVEFGPDLYGIGPAARHYFKTSPVEVTAEQSFSLAMLLPKPRKGLPDKVRVRKLMETLARLKVIPESMLVNDEPADFSDWQ